MNKEELANRVKPVDESVSKIILDESSEIKVLETPFLKNGNVHLVSSFAPTRMIEIYIGISGEDFTELIGGDGEKYNKFLQKAGLVLDNSELRLKYILNYLEVTKSGGDRFQILEGIDDIKKRPNLDENQEQDFAEFYEKYNSIISELKLTAPNKYRVYVILGQNLVTYDLTIGEDSMVEKTETLLEENLLIPYAL